MIHIIEHLPEPIIGFRYDGRLEPIDYDFTLFPAIETAFQKDKELVMLCEMAESFKGFKAGAVVDDFQHGVKYFKHWKKIAFVSEKRWLNHTIRTFGFLLPGQVRTFKTNKEAIQWLTD